MSSSFFKGPLPVLVLAGLAVLAARYVPFDELAERARQATSPATVSQAPSAPSPGTDNDPVPRPPIVVGAPATPAAGPPQPIESPLSMQTVAEPAAPVATASAPAQSQPSPVAAAPPMAVEPAPDVTVASTSAPDRVEAPAVQRPQTEPDRTEPRAIEPKATAATIAPPTARPATSVPKQPPTAPKVSKPTVVASLSQPKPVPPAAPVRPALRIFVEADAHERAGLGNLTPTEYARLLRGELLAIAADYLGPDAVARDDSNLAFRADLADGRSGIDRLCAKAQTPRVLLADVTVESAGFSSLPSAYWPDVTFTAISCADGRVHKSQAQRLEPQRTDRFEYQQLFARRSQDFIASQGYFLKP